MSGSEDNISTEERQHSINTSNVIYTHSTVINSKNDLLFDCSFDDSVQSVFVNFESFGVKKDIEKIIRMKLMFRAENGKLIEIKSARKIEQDSSRCEVEIKSLSIYFRIKNVKSDINFTSCCGLIITTEE